MHRRGLQRIVGSSSRGWRSPLALAAVLLLCLASQAGRADYLLRPEARAFIHRMVVEHGFSQASLNVLFNRTERKDSILKAIARPAERTKLWYEYRDIFLTRKRIEQGLKFWQGNAEVLHRAAVQFNVAPEIIVAVIGVETRYGKQTGSYRVVDALSTLAFDYPPRSRFFLQELEQFLLLAREEGLDPLSVKGSYAGAMGFGQFIPSSYRAYAVDFDGDHKRDIWNNTSDAIGSIANYFAKHGWQKNGVVAVRALLPGGSNQQIEKVANSSLKPAISVAELHRIGVTVSDSHATAPFALFRMEGEKSPEYWLGLQNFYVITRYNRSRLYALAVYQLGQCIARQRRLEMVSH